MVDVDTKLKFPVLAAEDVVFDKGDCEDFMDFLNAEEFESFNPAADLASPSAVVHKDVGGHAPFPHSDDTQSGGSTPSEYLDLASPGSSFSGENGDCASAGSESDGVSQPLPSSAPLDPKEDKKRRNRLAAKMSRAKKKRVMQSIEERQDYLEHERQALKKENEELRSTNRALEKQLAFFHGIFKANTDAAFKLPSGMSIFENGGSTDDRSKSPAQPGTGLAMGFVFLAVFSAGKLDDFSAPLRVEHLDFQPPRRAGRTLLSVEDDGMAFADVPAMPSLGIAHATALAAALAVVAYVLIWAFKAYLTWRGAAAMTMGAGEESVGVGSAKSDRGGREEWGKGEAGEGEGEREECVGDGRTRQKCVGARQAAM